MIDFQQVASSALPHLELLCMELLPGGKKTGREYVCASSDGGKGRSFSVNTQTGTWADFSGTDKGGDAVSLVACVRRTNQADAARALVERGNFSPNALGSEEAHVAEQCRNARDFADSRRKFGHAERISVENVDVCHFVRLQKCKKAP